MFNIFKRFFIFLLLFVTWLDIVKFSVLPVSKIGFSVPIFPQLQINMLKSQNDSMVQDALDMTSKELLQYLVPKLSNEDWNVEHIFTDLLSDSEEEVAISMSLSPDRGILIILQKLNKSYYLAYYNDNLLPINKLEVLPHKNNKAFLVTCEDHKEQLGAFCETNIVKLWKWKEGTLQDVLTENSHQDIYWLNSWQNPKSSPQKWYNLNQHLTITYRQDINELFLITEGKQEFAEALAKSSNLPAPNEFSDLNSRNINQKYYWDNTWHKFILDTCSCIHPNNKSTSTVAILKDLDYSLNSLASPTNDHMYEVIDNQGNVFSINSSSVLYISPLNH
ncbi:MAG: hypothetical protein PHI90_08970 [Clostridia bacterium]|nr:hypothetical protein [Clostridia bacterium]